MTQTVWKGKFVNQEPTKTATITALNPGAQWEPSSQVRWQKRGDGVCLQQLWISPLGIEEWRDVPVVDVHGVRIYKSVIVS